MSRSSSGHGGTWLTIASLAVLFYGAEHWRRRAARRASAVETQRFEALAVCALGADAGGLIYAPGAMRRRLRALAMQTSLEAEGTWLDRCVPMARLLAVHGTEVDSTGQLTRAPSHVEMRATELARALARVGLVWQVRAGESAVDMDRIADLFAATAAEVGIAHGARFQTRENAVAPVVSETLPSLRLAVAGLTPLVAGGPTRFLVGAPLPLVSAVTVAHGALRAEVVSNAVASWWRVSDDGLLRVGSETDTPDGLSPVVLEGLRGTLGAGRIVAPTDRTDRTGVSYDAAIAVDSLWLAQGLRGQGAVLARVSGQNTTAARLDLGSTAAERARTEARQLDPRVAVTALGPTVWAAFTSPDEAPEGVDVTVVRTQGGARASVVRVPFAGDAVVMNGRRPELTFCQTAHAVWLFAAAHDGWRAMVVDAAGVRVVHEARPAARQWFDETITARCDAERVLVYSRERPRANPMMLCRDDGTCATVARPGGREPAGADGFVTQGVHGERVDHAERPFSAAALADGSVVATRSFGPVVSIARWTPAAGRWSADRAVFDAAGDEPGSAVTGVGLYAGGTHLLLAFTTASELRVSASDNGGGRWRVP